MTNQERLVSHKNWLFLDIATNRARCHRFFFFSRRLRPRLRRPFCWYVVGRRARARAYFFSLLSLMRRFVANFCVCREASGDESMLSASLTLASSHSLVFFSFFGAGLVLVWIFFPSVCITSVCVLFPYCFLFLCTFWCFCWKSSRDALGKTDVYRKKEKKNWKEQEFPWFRSLLWFPVLEAVLNNRLQESCIYFFVAAQFLLWCPARSSIII